MRSTELSSYVYDESPLFKILSWMYTNRALDHDKSEIARCANVSRSTVQTLVPLLIETGIIKSTRSVGKINMYAIDMSPTELTDLMRKKYSYLWVIA